MGTPYLSEIRIVSFNFAPLGWAMCNGQLLSINQNQALFALLGVTYGGNGTTTFALPNLRGRMAMHMGNAFTLGQSAGEAEVTLTQVQLPTHSHQAKADSAIANSGSPSGETWAAVSTSAYGSNANATMNPASVTTAGNGQPHNNMAPYLTLNFIIALQGIFPSQN